MLKYILDMFRTRKTWMVAAVMFATTIRIFGLDRPAEIFFDEHHYVKAARILIGMEPLDGMDKWRGKDDLIARSPDQNFSHPILGKFIIAAGILLFGDHGFGWGIMSALAGIGSLFLLFALVRRWWG